jgi:putative membrane protein
MTESPVPAAVHGFWLRIILIISAIICLAVGFLILGPRPEGMRGRIDVGALPTVNASLNALTTVLLLAGLALVKARRIVWHKRAMLTAFATSSLFLVSYVVYHWCKEGPRHYQGPHRGLYFFILITHIVLAAVILPLALRTLYWGWRDAIAQHKKIARVTFPLWLYVSVTGVVIYCMLY